VAFWGQLADGSKLLNNLQKVSSLAGSNMRNGGQPNELKNLVEHCQLFGQRQQSTIRTMLPSQHRKCYTQVPAAPPKGAAVRISTAAREGCRGAN